MTEELKQKAEMFIKHYFGIYDDEFEKAKENDEVVNTIKMLVEFATEVTKELEKERLRIIGVCSDREEGLRRKIAELKKRNEELDKALITSTKNNIERQKIIDKMKCCDNCKENTTFNPYCIDCENKSKWELAE